RLDRDRVARCDGELGRLLRIEPAPLDSVRGGGQHVTAGRGGARGVAGSLRMPGRASHQAREHERGRQRLPPTLAPKHVPLISHPAGESKVPPSGPATIYTRETPEKRASWMGADVKGYRMLTGW